MILAIKGHATRGAEVINALESLGGKNIHNYTGKDTNNVYFIDADDTIEMILYNNTPIAYTFLLEEFLDKYPFKIGDEVLSIYELGVIRRIIGMRWYDDSVVYRTQALFDNGYECSYKADCLRFYSPKEDTKLTANLPNDKNQEDGIISLVSEEKGMRIIPCDSYELKIEGNDIFVVRKQPPLPSTYKECCAILGIDEYNCVVGEFAIELEAFQKLLICRSAYWEIAGEELGLKPWKPVWDDYNPSPNYKYIISKRGNELFKDKSSIRNYVLAFPTKEMRDAFCKNFKELIEQCKELL